MGYAQIRKIERVNLEQAKSIQNDGAISENELENYFGNTSHVHAIWLAIIRFSKSHLTWKN